MKNDLTLQNLIDNCFTYIFDSDSEYNKCHNLKRNSLESKKKNKLLELPENEWLTSIVLSTNL